MTEKDWNVWEGSEAKGKFLIEFNFNVFDEKGQPSIANN